MSELTTDTTSTPTDRQARADRLFSNVIGWLGVVLALAVLHAAFSKLSMTITMPMFLLFGKMGGKPALVLWGLSLILIIVGFWGAIPRAWRNLRAWVSRGGVNSAFGIIGIILIAGLLNFFAHRTTVWRVDLTSNKRFSLAPRSKDVLRAMEDEVTVVAFVTTDAQRQGMGNRAKALLDLYQTAAPSKFSYEIKNPFADLSQLQQLGGLGPDLSGAILTYRGETESVAEFTERDITSALIKFSRPVKRKIYVLEGHGEHAREAGGELPINRSIQLALAELMTDQWEVEGISLVGEEAEMPSPDEAAVLIIAGPEREFFEGEEEKINSYMDQGGRVLVLLSPGQARLESFLNHWGIEPTRDLAIGTAVQDGLIVVGPEEYADHQITKNLGVSLFGRSLSLKAIEPAPTGVTVSVLASSGRRVRIIQNFQEGQPVNSAQTTEGPVDLALIAEKEVSPASEEDEAKRMRMIVVGDALFPSDFLIQGFQQGFNIVLFGNMVNWLAEEDALVSIPPKDEQPDQVFVTDDQKRLLMLVHYLDFPLLAAILGFVVYLKRR